MTETLHVTIDSPARALNALGDDLDRLAAGEDVQLADARTLTLPDVATLAELFRPTNTELLDAIAEHEPESIRAAARLVDRGPAEVLANLNELEAHGLVELRREGRAKRPVVWYDEIEITASLQVGGDDGDGEPATA